MTTQAQLNHAISEAHDALENVDHFDLDSNDPKSVKEMSRLENIHKESIRFVVKLARTYQETNSD